MTKDTSNKMKLVFKEREKFEGQAKIDYVTTNKLAKKINTIMNYTFCDYHGCEIKPGDMNLGEPSVLLTLDFIPDSDNGMGGVKAFTVVGTDIGNSNKSKNIDPNIELMLSFNQMNNTSIKVFEITQDAVDILGDYAVIAHNANVNKSAFNRYISEWTDKQWSNRGTVDIIHNTISCVDIDKIVNGYKEDAPDKGDKFYYQVTPVRPIYVPTALPDMGQPSTNFLYSISQISRKKLNELSEELGMMANASISRFNTSY